jgi:hypothetical protein
MGATPVVSDEDTGRRNWLRCCVVTDVTCTNLSLFPSGQITQAVLSGLIEQNQHPVHQAVSSKIEELLLLQKGGADVEMELDRQLTISLLPLRFQTLCQHKIQIQDHHLLHAQAVDDIAHIIRDIMVQKNHNDVLFKLYQYTMPFIKHNRLNFPPRRNVSKSLLKHLMQIMALTCLGLHSSKSKKQVWHIRRQLFIVFTQLQTQGSLADIYLFCQHHNYLVRLALMENFVHFTSKYMTVEMEFMRALTSTGYEHSKVERLVCYITDNFRMSALQNETLNWELIEEKAQIAIERCNRTCKSHPMPVLKRLPSAHNCIRSEAFKKLLQMPVVRAHNQISAMSDSDMLTMALRHNLNKHVRKYPLPVRIQHKQFSELTHNAQRVNCCTIVHRSLLHVCLRCMQQYTTTSNNMRIDFQHMPMCVRCNSGAYVFTADTLGHLVRVFRQYFYFCSVCNRVHAWTGKGNELFACQQARVEQRRKHCVVCWRTMQLTPKCVFDKKLGVMQNLFLCSKHCPQPTQMPYAVDLCSLRRLVQHIGK